MENATCCCVELRVRCICRCSQVKLHGICSWLSGAGRRQEFRQRGARHAAGAAGHHRAVRAVAQQRRQGGCQSARAEGY